MALCTVARCGPAAARAELGLFARACLTSLQSRSLGEPAVASPSPSAAGDAEWPGASPDPAVAPLDLPGQLRSIKEAGLFKWERVISSPQGPSVALQDTPDATARPNQPPAEVLNFCANNYLGLSNHPRVVQAARLALDTHGFGLSSVRFICGTQTLHRQLEQRLAHFHGTEDSILFPSCFDANAGVFEALLGPEDAVLSDELNHASIIDGIRLCKAQRMRYRHGDMADLESKLREAKGARVRLIATDGVFSMQGDLAPLDHICRLARQYSALVFVDDCHATGFLGPEGMGTPELFGVQDQVHIVNSTLGKALGGGTGGYTAASRDIVAMLRQRARPYLFSNSLAPPMAAAGIAALDVVSDTPSLRQRLAANTRQFRSGMAQRGFQLLPGEHPIVPIMLGDARLAHDMAERLLSMDIYVVGFSYPVVPKGQARIRVQISAAHSPEQIDRCIEAFAAVGRTLNVV